MKFLIDIHIFIWFSENSPKLLSSVKTIIENKKNTIFVSNASLWEIAIKVSIGKIELKKPLERVVEEAIEKEIDILPIENNHIFRVLTLPYHHKDPFDRMIIAQAITENLTVITHDPNFKLYELKVM